MDFLGGVMEDSEKFLQYPKARNKKSKKNNDNNNNNNNNDNNNNNSRAQLFEDELNLIQG